MPYTLYTLPNNRQKNGVVLYAEDIIAILMELSVEERRKILDWLEKFVDYNFRKNKSEEGHGD